MKGKARFKKKTNENRR